MRYSPVSPPQDLFLPYQQKDRQQSFLSRLLPIVFTDKSFRTFSQCSTSGIFAARAPAELGMLRTTNGQSVSWDSHPSEDRSEPPLQRKDGSIIIPGICIVASSRHHMICTANPAVIALRRSLTPLREVLASEAVLLRRSGKIRSTELFSFQGTSKAV